MKRKKLTFGLVAGTLLAASALAGAEALSSPGITAHATLTSAASGGIVLQTNLVSDLPGAARITDPNLVNPWGVSESAASPLWISDNNAGLATLYQVPGAGTPVAINPLVVKVPTPMNLAGGTPTGTVFNTAAAAGAFAITGPNKKGKTVTAAAVFLYDTEDGTIVGWNPAIDPGKQFSGAGGLSAQGVIAVDNSGNNFTNPNPAQQTGAVYKGLAIATAGTPIIVGDANSTALLYAANFRAGTIEVYDAHFTKVTSLPAGAFGDPAMPAGFAPFDVQVLNGKVFVTYAKQDAAKHDDVAGPHSGFVDVFNLNGTPGLAGGRVRLISRGSLDSPWGLAIAPKNFAGIKAPGTDPVLLVGNFGNGRINAFDATNGSPLGQLHDPDGGPIGIDGLWTLKVGNGTTGGAADTVYFTAGIFKESHGLFGSLSTVAAGTPEGPAEDQWVQANLDLVRMDLQQLDKDIAAGAPAAAIKQDVLILNADTSRMLGAERAFGSDAIGDLSPTTAKKNKENLQLLAMPSGQASFGSGSGGVLTANLSMIGLTPGSSHFVELSGPQGSGQLVTTFGSFTAAATGAIDTTLKSSFTGTIPKGSRLVVLNGQPGTAVGNEPIAQTGILNGGSTAGQMQLTAVEVNSNGKSFGTPQGTATVVFDSAAKTLTITVNASGFTPGAHAAHVHTGSCQAQGAVLFALQDLVANSNGDINGETRVVTGVTTSPLSKGFYLNLHQGSSNTILKNGKPAIAFRPLLCANF